MNDINNILQQVESFYDVYDLLKNKDNQIKGKFLEVFVKYYFMIHYPS